jgi:enoyl-CoA hydratase
VDDLRVEHDGAVLRLTLNAPQYLNAFTTPMVHALADEILGASGVRVAVISGVGRAFSSGARLSKDGANTGILDAAFRLVTAMTTAPFPVIASVDGPAVGIGCSIALAADIVVASERSYFLQAFIRIGLMPDGGATALLAASIGRAQALWLALSGEPISARSAVDRGLIASCIPDRDHAETVQHLVEQLASGPTLAYARTKAAVNLASLPQITNALELERAAQIVLQQSNDYREGVAAFTEKRPAAFRGD